MAEYLTNTTDLTAVANAIRAKSKMLGPLVYPDGFVEAINGISQGQGGASKIGLVKCNLKQPIFNKHEYVYYVCDINNQIAPNFVFFSWDITDKDDFKSGITNYEITIIVCYIPSLNINYGVVMYMDRMEGYMTTRTDMVYYDDQSMILKLKKDDGLTMVETDQWISKSNIGTVLYFDSIVT